MMQQVGNSIGIAIIYKNIKYCTTIMSYDISELFGTTWHVNNKPGCIFYFPVARIDKEPGILKFLYIFL
jgi:hypothetical protein